MEFQCFAGILYKKNRFDKINGKKISRFSDFAFYYETGAKNLLNSQSTYYARCMEM